MAVSFAGSGQINEGKVYQSVVEFRIRHVPCKNIFGVQQLSLALLICHVVLELVRRDTWTSCMISA